LQAYLSIRSPFRLNLFIAILCFALLTVVYKQILERASNVVPLVSLLLTIVFGVILFIGLIIIISLAISFLYFKSKGSLAQLNYSQDGMQTMLHLETQNLLNLPLLRPALALYFNNKQSTEPTALQSKNGLFVGKFTQSTAILSLPAAKTYQLQHLYLLFRDAFGLFNIPCKVQANTTISHLPTQQSFSIDINPKFTREPEILINEKKKVDGEYLRFKPFESTDDTRRILWKVYAKTKELMVRTPEIWNPYASELQCYASFYTKIATDVQDKHMQHALSSYKQKVYSIVQGLGNKKISLKFKSDQEHTSTSDLRMQITDSEWQQHLSLLNFASSPQPCIAIISGLAAADDVEEWLQNAKKHSLIFYIPIHQLFKQNIVASFLHRVFFVETQSIEKKLRFSWWRHPLRNSINKNEKKLEQLLIDSNLQFIKV
jgi:hypothetical protein